MARPNFYPTRKWWIDRHYHWLKLVRPSKIDAPSWRKIPRDTQRKLGFITLVLMFNLQLDWDGGDMNVWLGWFGIHAYYQVDNFMRFDGTRCSGIDLMWGRVNPLRAGEMLNKRGEVHAISHRDIPMRQVSIAGQFYLTNKDGQITL